MRYYVFTVILAYRIKKYNNVKLVPNRFMHKNKLKKMCVKYENM